MHLRVLSHFRSEHSTNSRVLGHSRSKYSRHSRALNHPFQVEVLQGLTSTQLFQVEALQALASTQPFQVEVLQGLASTQVIAGTQSNHVHGIASTQSFQVEVLHGFASTQMLQVDVPGTAVSFKMTRTRRQFIDWVSTIGTGTDWCWYADDLLLIRPFDHLQKVNPLPARTKPYNIRQPLSPDSVCKSHRITFDREPPPVYTRGGYQYYYLYAHGAVAIHPNYSKQRVAVAPLQWS